MGDACSNPIFRFAAKKIKKDVDASEDCGLLFFECDGPVAQLVRASG